MFFRETWGEWNQALFRLPRPKKEKKKPVGSYYTADFYFEVTQNGIPGEHYSFKDQIFSLKMFIHTNE